MKQHPSSYACTRVHGRVHRILRKIVVSLKILGLRRTTEKLVKHSVRKVFFDAKTIDANLARIHNIEDRFTQIYCKNHWGNFESVSGNGSTLEATRNIRQQLPVLFGRLSIKVIFDAPCGDFNWMKDVLSSCNVAYIGGDIVRPLIQELNSKFQDNNTRFMHVDITRDQFPPADLMICRDCLFHLSYDDTRLALKKFADSGIPYLLTSTYLNNGELKNYDIPSGGFRLIDLFSAPYLFPKDVLYRFDDSILNESPREMCVWSNEQVTSVLANFSMNIGAAHEQAPGN